MTIIEKKEKLHEFINTADDKKIDAIYTLFEDYIEEQLETSGSLLAMSKMNLMKQASSDPLFLADVKEVSDDFDFMDNEKI
jgi:hypothetical protein